MTRLNDGRAAVEVIAAAIQQAMHAFGWTQSDVSDRSGVSASQISRILSKKVRTVEPDTVERLNAVLGKYAVSTTSPVKPLQSLRAVVAQDRKCHELFNQAEILCRSLFDHERLDLQHAPFFTDHTPQHIAALEQILDQMLFGTEVDAFAFVPTPEESMYLLAACWLHDIGMLYGLFPEETSVGDDIDWGRIRDAHELRSAKYVQEHWHQECEWTYVERLILSEICIYHGLRYSLDNMEPAFGQSDRTGLPVRCRELAALLRLGKACHLGNSAVPGQLRRLLEATGISVTLQCGRSVLAAHVEFNHREMTIQPVCYLPPTTLAGTAVVDFKPLVDRVASELEAAVATVVPYLKNYSNVGFTSVRPHVGRPQALNESSYLADMWPAILPTATTPSEVASLVACILKALTRGMPEVPGDAIRGMLAFAHKLHRYNVLLHRLKCDVEKQLCEGISGPEFRNYLEQYLKRRTDACHDVARLAIRYINEDDTVVIYGYSHAVQTLLTETFRGHRGAILIVRSRGSILRVPGIVDENVRVVRDLDASQLEYNLIEFASLPEVFSRYRSRGTAIKVLVSPFGVLENGDVLARPGTSLISLAARANDIPVYVLFEEEKFVEVGDRLAAEIADELNDETDKVFELSTDIQGDVCDLTEVAPVLDCLKPEMYDTLITPADINVRN